MKKDEFLSGLRRALALELPESEIESNLQFYDEYIKSKMKEDNEEDVIRELGDPRLIAKTIVETYQISHGPVYQNMASNKSTNEYEYTDYEDESNYQSNNKGGFNFHINTSIKWYHKLILFLLLAIIFILIIFVSGVMIRLFFSIGLPLLIIYLGYTVIKNSMKK